jgi:hypothetical protein
MFPIKALAVVCVVSVPVIARNGAQMDQPFERYKLVEAYEIRPGILMMPRYASNGEVCEVGLEKRHYSPGLIRHGSDLSRKEIDEIADELAPPDERGAKSDILAGHELILTSGHGMTTISEYEHLTIEIHAWVLQSNEKGSTIEQDAAVIRWKDRKCE